MKYIGHSDPVSPNETILLTGATGFLGPAVLKALLHRGFRHVRCLARPTSPLSRIEAVARCYPHARVQVIKGNLLSQADCIEATKDASVIYHLAAARGEKSFPDAFSNSVVTTRNLLEAALRQPTLRRFVSVSSFAVYTNSGKPRRRLLDESCPVEGRPELRGDAYCFAKVKQDELVAQYGRTRGIPYVIVRPGYIYGPGNEAITGRVGIGTFGIFLHLGGSNTLPLTYVDNCADAVLLAGVTPDIDGHTFNVVDDQLPSSRRFLRLYKREVRSFPSIYVPHAVSYALCGLWEKYSNWSEGQLPLTFNRRSWRAYWQRTDYSNEKAKQRLGWMPLVPTQEGLRRYFESCRKVSCHA